LVLAPVVKLGNTKDKQLRMVARSIRGFTKKWDGREVFPFEPIDKKEGVSLADMMIKPNDENPLNCPTASHVSSAHFPNGSSGKSILHLGQIAKTGKFANYDYGSEKNLIMYGQEEAPILDVSQIKDVPIAIFAGLQDNYSSIEDVHWLKD